MVALAVRPAIYVYTYIYTRRAAPSILRCSQPDHFDSQRKLSPQAARAGPFSFPCLPSPLPLLAMPFRFLARTLPPSSGTVLFSTRKA